MFNSKRFFTLALCLTLLAGCGESFKGKQMTEADQINTESGTNYFTDDGFRNSVTPTDQDAIIARRYEDLLLGRETQIRSLTNSIEAFDLQMRVNSASDVELSAKVTYGCEDEVDYSRRISQSQLQSGNAISLGNQNNTQVEVQCTDSRCQEMVAVIIRQDNFNNAAVLVGLSANSSSNNSIFYLSRHVNYAPYYTTFHSGEFYRDQANCQVEEESRTDRIVDYLQEEATDFLVEEATNFLEDIFD